MAAFATQRLLGNKAFMKKLITTDPSTAEKLIGKIREMRENFKVRKDPAAKAQLEIVRKAEKLFMQGLSEAGGTIDSKGKIHLANREEDETVIESGETVIETAENVSESGKPVRRIANPKGIDSDTNKGYNDSEYMALRGWAEGVLSEEDRRLLRGKISEAEASGFEAHPQLSDGSYLFEVNNKIVLVTGDFNNPVYDGVVDINTDNATTASTIRKDIENATNGEGCTRTSFLKTIEKLYGTEVLMVYDRSDWGSAGADQGQSYPTRPAGYKDFGYSGEQRYGRRSAGEAENTVTQKKPSIKPVSKIFTDVTGKKRTVLGAGEGRYMVDGSIKNRNYIFDSPEAAIEAENKAIIASLARKYDHTHSWVAARLNEDPHYFTKKIRHSRTASGDTVTISKGEMAKLHANYAGEKVFDKKSVKDALASVEAYQKLPSKLRTEFVNRIWAGYNQRLHQQGFEQFTEVMWHQLHAEVLCYG